MGLNVDTYLIALLPVRGKYIHTAAALEVSAIRYFR